MDPADRRFFSGLIVALFAVGLLTYSFFLAGQAKAPTPFVQPSVPTLIPPPLSCLCGTTKQATRPFQVVCPYCRNTLSVQPSATGETIGATVTGATVNATAK